MREQQRLVLGNAPQHGHRIEQLLACPLELGERSLRALVRTLGLQTPEAPPRIAERLARLLQPGVERIELERANAFLLRAPGLVPGLDERPFLGSQIADAAGFSEQRTFERRKLLELPLEPDGFGARALGLDRRMQSAHAVAQSALIVDDPVKPRLEPVALVQLIGELLDPAQHDLEIDAGVVVRLRREPDRVVEPGRARAQRLDGPFGFLRLLRVGPGGERNAQVERRAVTQVDVGACLVARREKPVDG